MIITALKFVIGVASLAVGIFFLVTVVKWSQFGFSDLFWFFFVISGAAWIWSSVETIIKRTKGGDTAP